MRHPNVTAAAILGGCVLVAAVIVSLALHGLAREIRNKPVVSRTPTFPNTINLQTAPYGSLNVKVAPADPPPGK